MWYDVIIVGAGASGLTAALYAARRGLTTLVVSQDIGGQAATTSEIENYPGVDLVDGMELMEKFRAQAERFGAMIRLEEVTAVEKQGDDFAVTTTNGRYEGRSVILAFGLTHRHLGVPGEEALIGKGIVFCATCDAPLFVGKKIAVVGGGNSAMDAALLAVKNSPEVHLLTKNDELRGEQVLIDRIAGTPRVTVHYGTEVTRVIGNDRVTGIGYTTKGSAEELLSVEGVFVEIGFVVNASFVAGLTELDGKKQVVVSKDNGTSIPGLFASGDVTTIGFKQIVISAGEGARAALMAYRYLQARGVAAKGGPTDWGIVPTNASSLSIQ